MNKKNKILSNQLNLKLPEMQKNAKRKTLQSMEDKRKESDLQ
jgi:hypothetical protein